MSERVALRRNGSAVVCNCACLQRMVATHEKPGEAAHFCSRFSSTKWCGKKIGLSLSLHCDESTGVGGVRLRGEGIVGARARAS